MSTSYCRIQSHFSHRSFVLSKKGRTISHRLQNRNASPRPKPSRSSQPFNPAIYNGERFSLDDGGQHSTPRMKRNHRLKCFLNPQHRAHSRCSLRGLSDRSLLFRAVGVAASIRISRFSQWLGRSKAKALIHHFYQQLIGVFKNIEVRIHQLITHNFVHGIIFFPEVGVVFVTAGHVMA